jgi:hypothetical protein
LDEAGRMAVVKITMRFSAVSELEEPRTLSTVVALDAQSASIDFAEPGYGFRLPRILHPVVGPAGVVGRRFADWGVIVLGGRDPTRDRGGLYTFLLREGFTESRVDSVIELEDVREPVAMGFGPEESQLDGSLFIASSGLRIGHLTSTGIFLPESPLKSAPYRGEDFPLRWSLPTAASFLWWRGGWEIR